MTRDGTFYVEDGQVRHGILNFRFNESLIHMLSNVEAMGTPVRASGEESFDMVAPPMKVPRFQFHRSDEVLKEFAALGRQPSARHGLVHLIWIVPSCKSLDFPRNSMMCKAYAY